MSHHSTALIESWHSHVYFDAASRDAAWLLREKLVEHFAGRMEMGRFHERAVGPHPRFSYQLAYTPGHFAEIMAWLALNRGDLVVFTHPNTGDALVDHRDRAIWMGATLPLKLEALG
ncbi:MAG: DOPA 4,5-dioxygenase family protein [Reyranellaceae bacterium]